MKKITVCFLLALFFCPAVQAGGLNMGKLSCETYFHKIEQLMKKEGAQMQASGLMLFLYGHAAAQRDSDLYDAQEFKQVFHALGKACEKSPKTPVTEALQSAWNNLSAEAPAPAAPAEKK